MTMHRRDIIQFAGALSLFSLAPSLSLASKSKSKFLILIELDGANDGLNTVVPFRGPKSAVRGRWAQQQQWLLPVCVL